MGKKILFVSHDAGGANILCHFIEELKIESSIIAKGPAEIIFKKQGLNVMGDLSNHKAFSFDSVVTGTSSRSKLEVSILQLANYRKIPTYTFIDNWANYRGRFEFTKKLILPNYLITGDQFSYELAMQEFKDLSTAVVFYRNPYFEYFRKLGKNTGRSKSNKFKILYFSEPAGSHARNMQNNLKILGYDEFDVLKIVTKEVTDAALKSRNIELYIRLHPSEKKGKYDKIFSSLKIDNIKIILSSNSLEKDLENADLCLGTNTTALAVAHHFGIKTFSVVPENGFPSTLPKAYLNGSGVRKLKDYIEKNNK